MNLDVIFVVVWMVTLLCTSVGLWNFGKNHTTPWYYFLLASLGWALLIVFWFN